MTRADPEPTAGPLRPALSLLAAALLITLVWCGVLPWLSARPSNSQYLQFLDEQGIDPSAMFYTELDAMDPILRRIEEPWLGDVRRRRWWEGEHGTDILGKQGWHTDQAKDNDKQ